MSNPELVELGWFPTEMSAHAATSALDAAGIECVIERDDPGGSAAFTRIDRGARLFVPRHALGTARDILDMSPKREAARPGQEVLATRQHVSTESITAGLHEIRKRRRMVWAMFLGFPLIVPLVLRWFGERGIYAMVLWAIAYVAVGRRAAAAECPRCGNSFSSMRGLQHPLEPALPSLWIAVARRRRRPVTRMSAHVMADPSRIAPPITGARPGELVRR